LDFVLAGEGQLQRTAADGVRKIAASLAKSGLRSRPPARLRHFPQSPCILIALYPRI
jgi:hypothetical protein